MFRAIQNASRDPKLSKRSQHQVRRTRYDHPYPQCRLDTYMAGYFCKDHRELNVDNSDANVGFCVGKERSNAIRPRCWFNPKKY